jgi:hypothetical protein
MLENRSGVFFVAGIFFFGLAFVSQAVVPILMYRDQPEKTAEQLVNPNVRYQMEDLAKRFPESFKEAFGEMPPAGKDREIWLNQRCADALRIGKKAYVGEACWHCHSQFVRPVSNEDRRWGPVAKAEEYQNELQRPVLFGTRRVGPDLSREGGRRSNDWHAVHLFQPNSLIAGSPMPSYPWYFNGSPDKPNKKGLSLILYLQWLGSWLESYPYYEDYKASPLKLPESKSSRPEPAVASNDTGGDRS